MSPTGPRNRALRCPQRPAVDARGMNTPDDPSLYGPSPTPHPNRPGNRGMVKCQQEEQRFRAHSLTFAQLRSAID